MWRDASWFQRTIRDLKLVWRRQLTYYIAAARSSNRGTPSLCPGSGQVNYAVRAQGMTLTFCSKTNVVYRQQHLVNRVETACALPNIGLNSASNVTQAGRGCGPVDLTQR